MKKVVFSLAFIVIFATIGCQKEMIVVPVAVNDPGKLEINGQRMSGYLLANPVDILSKDQQEIYCDDSALLDQIDKMKLVPGKPGWVFPLEFNSNKSLALIANEIRRMKTSDGDSLELASLSDLLTLGIEHGPDHSWWNSNFVCLNIPKKINFGNNKLEDAAIFLDGQRYIYNEENNTHYISNFSLRIVQRAENWGRVRALVRKKKK